MPEESADLYELLNTSIGLHQGAIVNVTALHSLLRAILGQLDDLEKKTKRREAPPAGSHPEHAAVHQDRLSEEEEDHGDVHTEEQEVQEVQPCSELQEQTGPASSQASSSSSSRPLRLLSRIQICEDGVSKAMKLIQELREQQEAVGARAEAVNTQAEAVNTQAEAVSAQAEAVAAVEERCDPEDGPEETVRDAFQKCEAPEELSQCVTQENVQAAELAEAGGLQEALTHSGGPATAAQPTNTPSNCTFTAVNGAPCDAGTTSSAQPVEATGGPAGPGSPSVSGQVSALQEATSSNDAQLATETPSCPSGPPQQVHPQAGPTAAGVPRSRQAAGRPDKKEAQNNVDQLEERFNKLEAHVAALDERKLNKSQLAHLGELIASEGSEESLDSLDLLEQLNQQEAVIDGPLSEQEKLDAVEGRHREGTSEAASRSAHLDSRASRVLRQQISKLSSAVQKLEEDVKQLKAERALTEEKTINRHLQDQLDALRGSLEDMMLSLTSQLSFSCQDEAGPEDSETQGLPPSDDRSAFTGVGRMLGSLFQHYEQLQDKVNSLLHRQTGGSESVELVNDVQKAILQLQEECEKLHGTTRCLYEDNKQKQSQIEKLYETMEVLQEKKADKQISESEVKVDQSALDSKVSHLHFDAVTEQLNAMFHELLNKVSSQEQDWHKVIDRLSAEMESKLNRIELDSVKKQLEELWRKIHEQLQAQGAPELGDAAGLKKQLVERFHCLSCDRPVSSTGPVTPASNSGFPSRRSIRPFTVYAVEQVRQHYRSLKPGTNRHNFEVAVANKRRHRSPTVAGRQRAVRAD